MAVVCASIQGVWTRLSGTAENLSASERMGLPGHCRLCRAWGIGAWCAACDARFRSAAHRCVRCALVLPANDPAAPAPRVCGPCLRRPPPWSAAVCAEDYAFPWDRLIADLKFHDQPEVARPLAERLAQAVRDALETSDAALPELLVPVPLSARRLRERGYNQAWELARRLGAALGIGADAQLLLRPVDTAHQATLPRAERERNLRGAFMVDPARRSAVDGRRIALVDDVMTTGATLREATLELLRAGAAEVQVWAIARTA
jgi:ComF family protein